MIGQQILHYRIIEKTGEGGMGVVYKAEDTKLGRIVAVKLLPPHTADQGDKRERFKIEARAAAAINHPNVATIHAIEEIDDNIVIIMEFVSGHQLRKLLDAAEPLRGSPGLEIGEGLRYASQIVRGLKAAHDKGVVHRDIKPDNIIVNMAGQIKIMDFGLAKMEDLESLTEVGTVMGTVAYMSPEQIRGTSIDLRTDIWSWGVTFYEMIAGRHPFKRVSNPATIYAILDDNPEPLRKYRPDALAEMEDIVSRALAKEPSERYSDCDELLRDLKSCAPPGTDAGAIALASGTATERDSEFGELPHWVGVRGEQVALRKKIAVLPFTNMNGAPEYEYFSDGVTEDILTELVKIGDLRVISRTTTALYKGSKKGLREIGRELGVGVILEGSVRRESDRVRIAAQLIDARTDEHLWAETYDRRLEEVFAIQTEIAQKIAEALHARLSPSERKRLRTTVVSHPRAYSLLLQGRYLYARGRREDVAGAIDHYLQAVAMEPHDARAWSLLAGAYARQGDSGALSTEDAYGKAREAAEKALSLDDDLAMGHIIMGWIKRSYDWDWLGAEAELRKAMKLAPGDFVVIRNMAKLAWTLGRFEEAIDLARRACDIDPLRVANYTTLGFNLMYVGKLEEALACFQRALELDPQYPTARTFLGLAYVLLGDVERAVAEINSEPDEGWRLYGLSQAYHAASRAAEADAALEELITRFQDESAYQIAQVYAYRGDADRAFDWLEKAYIMRDGGLTEMMGDPFLRKIESDPRYRAFMKKMKLPG